MQETSDIQYLAKEPTHLLADYVKIFWHLQNNSSEKKSVTILPDGYFDILFTTINGRPFKALLMGLSTKPLTGFVPANAEVFAISFKLPAADYILKENIADLINKKQSLPQPFWQIDSPGFTDFNNFIHITTEKILGRLTNKMEDREKNLFDIIYASSGSVKVEEIATSLFWNSRQINRYFKSRFGISLKAYCNILRFRASFSQLKNGRLFPEQDYFDQAHFIREVKKFSAASPKYLAANENDRFIQLSTLAK